MSAWPVGGATSSVIVTLSLALLPALSVAVIERDPGEEAPVLQVLSVALVLQPLTPERSGYVTLVTAVSGLENVPASGVKAEHESPERVPVSRVTVALEVSRPAAPSPPLPSEKVTEAEP